MIPAEIVLQYNLEALPSKGWVYLEIRKGMPGLKQAGNVANDRLKHHLAKFGYAPVPRTPALWRHSTRDITFSLIVDDFGVKYVGKHNDGHLIAALQDLYTISLDWTGSMYCGLII